MSSEINKAEGFHHDKREEIAEQVEPFFEGGPIWKRPFFGVFIIWAVMTVIGVLIGLFVPVHVLNGSSSTEQNSVKLTIIVFTVAAAPVSAIVYGIAAYSLFKWNKRGSGKSDTPPEDGPPIRGHGPATIIWISVSVVLVVFLLFWGMTVLSANSTPQANSIRVQAVGQQWVWTFEYGSTKINSTELVLPIDRQVVFEVSSKDVTHGFYPVQLGVQVDANPGFTTTISASPNKLGKFDVRCSQLCGLEHAYMQTTGRVVTEKQFEHWLAQKGATPAAIKHFTTNAS
jgi:cytochrome c oxidase subunit 2